MSYTELMQLYDNLINTYNDLHNDLKNFGVDKEALYKNFDSMKSQYGEDALQFAESFLEKTQALEDENGDLSYEDLEQILVEIAAWQTDGKSSPKDSGSNIGAMDSPINSDKANISFVSEDAGYSSALYTYDVGENGEISNIRLLIENTNQQQPEQLGEVSMHDGKPNLLLLSNGASQINAGSVLEYKDNQLLIDGQSYTGMGFFSHDNQLDIGHTPSAQSPNQFIFDEVTGEVRIEDICTGRNNCDYDYNDLVLKIEGIKEKPPIETTKVDDHNQCTPDVEHTRCSVIEDNSVPSSRSLDQQASPRRDTAEIDVFINPIEEMANDMAVVVDDANADFQAAITNIDDTSSFSDLIYAQAGAANLTATVSASTGALNAVTSAASTTSGKIGQ